MSVQNENISSELALWLEQEKKLGTLFSPESMKTSEFMKEKLKYLDFLARKYDRNLSPFEKLLVRVMNIERERLEKMLYPYWIQRVARSVLEPRSNPYFSVEQSVRKKMDAGVAARGGDSVAGAREISPKPEQVLKTLAEKPVKELKSGLKNFNPGQLESLLPKKKPGEKNGLSI